ncbi:Smr/MutS family protein [Caenispirillum salinarum]|nr:Smr/MutS family protein [Caenispirillum salinarum]
MARRGRKRSLTPDEAALWQAVVQTAEPLAPARARPAAPDTESEPAPDPEAEAPPVPPIPRPSKSGYRASSGGMAAVHGAQTPAAEAKKRLQQLSHGQTAGIDRRTASRFTRGRMNIDGRIDLHGMTQETAHRALCGFLARAYDKGSRCVIVVTGKGSRGGEGGGVLRRMVPMWLNEPGLRSRILSFSHAQPRDGGEGALYVLLKRKRGG